jgi:ketosteroid isomerase-like protein
MSRIRLASAACGALLFLSILQAVASASATGTAELEALAAQVRMTEAAFAATMASRDHAAFTSFLDDEAVFFGRGVLRGKQAVAAGWKGFFEGAEPPFSWAPEQVEVLASGTLALSSGPVYDPGGKRIATFSSIWRRTVEGKWTIVFDKGCPHCEEAPKPQQ